MLLLDEKVLHQSHESEAESADFKLRKLEFLSRKMEVSCFLFLFYL